MTEQKQEEVRDYLCSWTDQDWALLDDLYNDGVPLPAAIVRVHRLTGIRKLEIATREFCFAQAATPTTSNTEQPELMLV